ncbi:MAG: rane protein [Frankiales bacterium]|nr:rane protein [Frankiales bacterium]
MRRPSSGQVLGAFLGSAGVTHFVAPGFFDKIVPHALPGPARAWTYVSGVAEMGVGAGVLTSPRKGGLIAAALFLAVFPGNIQQAVDATSTQDKVISYARLPLQVPLVIWGLKVSRAAGRRGSRVPAR